VLEFASEAHADFHAGREEEIRLAYGKVDPKDALRDAKDAAHRLKDNKKGNGASGLSTQEPGTQATYHGLASGNETGAQDEIGKTPPILEPSLEPIETPMHDVTNQEDNAGPRVLYSPPSRSWTNTSAATTTTMSLKTIKAFSRKPTPKFIVSQWLASNYGSEGCRKRKRMRANMEEAPVGESGVGGPPLGAINLLLSPEQVGVDDAYYGAGEDLTIMVASHSDQEAMRASKRRKVEILPPPHITAYSFPVP
jgi:hypothetical protein